MYHSFRCSGDTSKVIDSHKKKTKKKSNRLCVIRPTNETNTFQTCPKSFGRFDPRTKSHHFKVCQSCRPQPEAMLPTVIFSKEGKHDRKYSQNNIYNIVNQCEPPPTHRQIDRLLSKVQVHQKNWQANPITGEMENLTAEHFENQFGEQPHAHKTV